MTGTWRSANGRTWEQVLAEAREKVEDPNVPEDIKEKLRAGLARHEAWRIGFLADLDQLSAMWEDRCREWGV